MINSILKSRKSGKNKVKSLISYFARSRGARKAWKKRHRVVFDKHPDFKKPAETKKEKTHKDYWSEFSFNFKIDTFRICNAISENADPKIIPEEIFQADIEPSLNRLNEAHYQANKSLYNRKFQNGIFPKNFLHNINGELLDADYNSIREQKLSDIVKTYNYPVILKPNLDSWGGNDINFIKSPELLLKKIKENNNFVVQERIEQHEVLSRLHPESLNTVRVYLYKSVKDNAFHIVNMAQRMGNGRNVDNVASGGLISLVKDNGTLHGYALDRYGKKFETHPATGLPFNQDLPDFEEMKNLAQKAASKLFHLRVVGLDMCYDNTGTWRIIEINTKGHSIRFAQYPGRPFFGKFIDEVLEYCNEHHWAKGE